MVLEGRVALVVGTGTDLGDGIATALTDAGATLATRAEERLDIVVHASLPMFEPRLLVDIDDAVFEEVWEQTMTSTVESLRIAHDQGATRVVVVTSTVGMSGGAGLAPVAAAAEGQRLLAKSAARQWGSEGITVNCVAVAPPGADDSISLSPAALPVPADATVDVGALIVALVSDGAHYLTGATLNADGGIWMSP